MINYKDLGLVNSREMFKKAFEVNMQYLHLTSIIWNNCRL